MWMGCQRWRGPLEDCSSLNSCMWVNWRAAACLHGLFLALSWWRGIGLAFWLGVKQDWSSGVLSRAGKRLLKKAEGCQKLLVLALFFTGYCLHPFWQPILCLGLWLWSGLAFGFGGSKRANLQQVSCCSGVSKGRWGLSDGFSPGSVFIWASSCAINPLSVVKVRFLGGIMAQSSFLGGAVKRLWKQYVEFRSFLPHWDVLSTWLLLWGFFASGNWSSVCIIPSYII